METLTLAAVSLIIAVSLMIGANKTPLHRSFAWLCFSLFVYKGADYFGVLFATDILIFFETIGLLAVAPFGVRFTNVLLSRQKIPAERHVAMITAVSVCLGIIAYFAFHTGFILSGIQAYVPVVLQVYVTAVIFACFLILIIYFKTKAAGAEKKRLRYLVIACTITFVIIALEHITTAAFAFPLHGDIILAALIYLILMIITHPELTALHDIMARAAVIFMMTCLAAVIFVIFTGLFGKTAAPLSHIFVASFIIVISIEPFRQVLKRILAMIYPDSPDMFASLYALDEKMEREKTQLLEEMAPVLAHEIRNPLGSMKGAAQYLRSEEKDEGHQRLLDVIIEEVDRLNSVVSQFLNYAKPYQMNLKEQRLNPLVSRAVSIIKSGALAENLVVEEDLHPDLPDVRIDAEQMLQVVLNLAYNAIESMPDGGTLIFRTFGITGETGAAVGLSIRDTGKGIKREDIKNIFKPFFTTKERGVGLGLPICQRIIKNHGGRLRVKSIPGQGSVFYIRLELANTI